MANWLKPKRLLTFCDNLNRLSGKHFHKNISDRMLQRLDISSVDWTFDFRAPSGYFSAGQTFNLFSILYLKLNFGGNRTGKLTDEKQMTILHDEMFKTNILMQ